MRIALSAAVAATLVVPHLSEGKVRVIYGADNRLEVSEASPLQQKIAQSAASMISEKQMTRDPARPGLVQLNQRTLSEWLNTQDEKQIERKLFSPKILQVSAEGLNFCPGERFIDQPNPSMCSGFLIGPDLVATAGHCVELPDFCTEFKWVFDFKVDDRTKSAGVDVKEEDIYSCEKVVSSSLSMPLGLDYAVVKLDRKVIGREPLEIRSTGIVEDKEDLFVVGSPSGLPLKVAGGAQVRTNTHPMHFNANLDTFQGNSGSGVFNAETGVAEGILVRGEQDFAPNMTKMCVEAFKCEDNSCRGEDVTRLTAIPEVAVQTTLNQAAMSGNTAVIEALLKLNLWIDFYTKDGQSALMKAVQGSKKNAVDLLLSRGGRSQSSGC